MCNPRPGRRCATDTFRRLKVLRDELAALDEDARPIDRARLMEKIMLAEADYAACFKDVNPALHAAACTIRDEQVALMPPKPADGEAGLAEWEELARARDVLASALTATWQAEMQGRTVHTVEQASYEAAVHEVRMAEKAWRRARWQDYDVVAAAERFYTPTVRTSDKEAQLGQDVVRLARDPSWIDRAHRRVVSASTSAEWYEAQAELARAERAKEAVVRLIDQVYPHALLSTLPNLPVSEHLGPGRTPIATDTAQVRLLAGEGVVQVRWDNNAREIVVDRPHRSVLPRLWAYGYHTVDVGHGRYHVTKVPAPVRSARRRAAGAGG